MTGRSTAPLKVFTRPEDVPGLAEGWSKVKKNAAFFCPGFKDYAALSAGPDGDPRRIGVLETSDGGRLTLPFVLACHQHSFTIGERRLGSLRMKALRLVNPWLANGHTAEDIARLLAHVMRTERVDLIDLGEIPENSDLRAGLDHLSWPARKLRLGRKKSIRWLIDLPATFEAYLGSLSKKHRQRLTWTLRRLEKDFDCRVETIADPADVQRFLEAGEAISRKTYQWNVGQQLRNDDATRKGFQNLAEQGNLRGYLLSLDGTPRAFARGVLEDDIFHYDTPGYDPDFASQSIGTVLFLNMLKDLMATASCKTFDFGTGGDETGFKSRFGNRQIPCGSYYVVNAIQPRALLVLTAETALSGMKNLADRLLPNGAVRARIKRWLRKYGD